MLRPLGHPFELIVVDDGSSDATVDTLCGLLAATPELVVVGLRRNFGQTSALQAGLDRARGDVIVTLDGDLQNDPADIQMLLTKLLDENLDVVAGWRKDRKDKIGINILTLVGSFVRSFLIPDILANRSHAAISRPAFAMLCPRTWDSAGKISRGCPKSTPSTRDTRYCVKMCHAVSEVSAL